MTITVEPEITVDFAACEELDNLLEQDKEAQSKADPLKSGFVWYTPPMSSQQHETNGQQWIIAGHDMQVLMMTVPPNETVTTETGSFFFGSADIRTAVEFTCCQGGNGCQRICGGERCIKVLLKNDGPNEGYVGLTPNFPAKIIPLQFGKHIQEDHMLLAHPGSYMAQLGDVDVSCDLDCSFMTCCCAGLGCCRQKITGTKNSMAFLAAGGTLVYRQLQQGETIVVDSNSVVAIEQSVSLGVTPNGRCAVCCFGGEGCFATTLSGPGKVFLQSMSFSKFQAAVQQRIDRGENNDGSDE